VVTNLALSASGVGVESCPDSPEERFVLHPSYTYYILYNLDIILMALHEHPILFWPTSTIIRLTSTSYHPAPLQSVYAVAFYMV